MPKELENRIAIITGAGRGIGRQYAHLFGAEGAKIVVNDTGAERDGAKGDASLAETVANEVREAGGEAISSTHDVAEMKETQALFDLALETYGGVDVVINNAGVLRDKMIFSMSEDDWDSAMRGHLRTTFCMTRIAGAWWREESKADRQPFACIINTSSTSGLIGAIGQSNYGAAKAGIAAFSVICATELVRYGVRVNAISPTARTRMTEEVPGLSDLVAAPENPAEFDIYHPRHPASLVGWLATKDCPVTGRVFMVKGGDIRWWTPWTRNDLYSEKDDIDIAGVGKLMEGLPPLPEKQ